MVLYCDGDNGMELCNTGYSASDILQMEEVEEEPVGKYIKGVEVKI